MKVRKGIKVYLDVNEIKEVLWDYVVKKYPEYADKNIYDFEWDVGKGADAQFEIIDDWGEEV